MGRINVWLPVLAAALLVALAVLSIKATVAGAETKAQRDVAAERVMREAKKLQRENKYRVRRGGKTVIVTPRASYFIWGTSDADAEVTMRWRIRVRTKPQAGTAGLLVCKGRVTVRGEPVDDAAKLRAALATDSCIA